MSRQWKKPYRDPNYYGGALMHHAITESVMQIKSQAKARKLRRQARRLQVKLLKRNQARYANFPSDRNAASQDRCATTQRPPSANGLVGLTAQTPKLVEKSPSPHDTGLTASHGQAKHTRVQSGAHGAGR